jgi:hypothetical protein
MEVTASSCLEDQRLGAQNAANAAAETNFVSKNLPGQWLRYDFENGKVKLTHYTIRSRHDGYKGSNNPRDWVVEVSNDASNWVKIDQQSGNRDLDGKNVTKLFQVTDQCPESRCVQIRQLGPTHSGKNFLVVSRFELFGWLTD